MAIGLGLLFGIRLPWNFNSPYKALNSSDFWRRWHMTLSRWLRDYLYIPLGGNRKGTARQYANNFTTMVLGGLWHGAHWNFVIWGVLHGLYLITNQVFRVGARRLNVLGFAEQDTRFRLFSWGVMFLATVIAWVFFRATTSSGAMSMIQSMLLGGEGIQIIMPAATFVVMAVAALIAFLAPNTKQISEAFNQPGVTLNWLKPAAYGVFAGMAGAAAYLGGQSLTLTLGLYVVFVSSQITRSDVPATYKWFLLSELPGSRLIIESGSNGHIGLDTAAISKALGMTAINVADNGGYDIEQKAARIAEHARPGDVVVLPLEWVYYSRQALTDDFVDNLPALNRDYFNSVGWRDRIKLALSLPPASVFGFQKVGYEAADVGALSHVQSLYVAMLTQPSGHVSYEAPRPLAAGVAGQTCDEYLFGPGPYKISDKFRRALKRFAKLKQTGVEAVFAWPVMVGDECFASTGEVHAFAKRIEQTVLDAGLAFVGRPSDALYPAPLRDDTPYHLSAPVRR